MIIALKLTVLQLPMTTMIIPPPEAGTPVTTAAGTTSPPTSMPECAAAVATPLIAELPDDELPEDAELPDDELLDKDKELPADEELPDADESPLLAPHEPSRSQREPRYSRPIARRKPAKIQEALAALHRKVTAPANVPSGRVVRGRSPISGDPPDPPPPSPPSDHGTPDLGSAT